MTKEALKMALEALECLKRDFDADQFEWEISDVAITAIKAALAQPEQEPVAWKLMPRDATDAMLKSMDECSTEGYDERLYAGHAASVYMAAWDASDTHPPQRTWVGLTDEDELDWEEGGNLKDLVKAIEAKLKEKNT